MMTRPAETVMYGFSEAISSESFNSGALSHNEEITGINFIERMLYGDDLIVSTKVKYSSSVSCTFKLEQERFRATMKQFMISFKTLAEP